MTHYSENPGNVRLDYFKPGGKWYETLTLDMSNHWDDGPTTHDAVTNAICADERLGPLWLSSKLAQEWYIVVLEPYHRHAHPIMLKHSAFA